MQVNQLDQNTLTTTLPNPAQRAHQSQIPRPTQRSTPSTAKFHAPTQPSAPSRAKSAPNPAQRAHQRVQSLSGKPVWGKMSKPTRFLRKFHSLRWTLLGSSHHKWILKIPSGRMRRDRCSSFVALKMKSVPDLRYPWIMPLGWSFITVVAFLQMSSSPFRTYHIRHI